MNNELVQHVGSTINVGMQWKSAANAVAVNRWQDYSPNFKGSIATINLLKKPFYDFKKWHSFYFKK